MPSQDAQFLCGSALWECGYKGTDVLAATVRTATKSLCPREEGQGAGNLKPHLEKQLCLSRCGFHPVVVRVYTFIHLHIYPGLL